MGWRCRGTSESPWSDPENDGSSLACVVTVEARDGGGVVAVVVLRVLFVAAVDDRIVAEFLPPPIVVLARRLLRRNAGRAGPVVVISGSFSAIRFGRQLNIGTTSDVGSRPVDGVERLDGTLWLF